MEAYGLTGRVALITGGGGDIGSVTGRVLAGYGARVVLADIAPDKAEEKAASLRALGLDATPVSLDIRDREACARAVGQVSRLLGPVSILVNNAGLAGVARMGDQTSAAEWDHSIGVNLTGAYNMAVACLPDLKVTKGCIVNISSVTAFTSAFAQVGYTASKGGIRSLTQAMCRELTEFGIRTNAVAPGYMDTSYKPKSQAAIEDWARFHCPMKRLGQVEEVAEVIAFLVSDKASFVNGVTMPVDGGYLTI